MMRESDMEKLDAVINFLSVNDYFTKWSRKQLTKLTFYIQEETHPRNKMFFREKEVCKFVYLIKEGQVALSKLFPDIDKEKKEIGTKISIMDTNETTRTEV